jgi:hypothetical protein
MKAGRLWTVILGTMAAGWAQTARTYTPPRTPDVEGTLSGYRAAEKAAGR